MCHNTGQSQMFFDNLMDVHGTQLVQYEVHIMEHKTLGQMLGTTAHSFKVTGDSGWKQSATINIDFRNVTDNDIKSWLCSNRVIAGQRTWRTMDLEGFDDDVNGQTFDANAIGRKVKTLAERKKEARMILDALKNAHPEAYQELMDNQV